MNVVHALLLLAVLAVCGCAASGKAAREKHVTVIAHRGASAEAPENTLAAFRRAGEAGADYFELDCTLSADGAVIIIHDDKLDRTTNGKGKVAEMTFDALRQLDAGSWKDARYAGELIPTLDEALALAGRSTGAYIEIKAHEDSAAARAKALELTEKVVAAVQAHKAEQHVVIQSFAASSCAAAKRLAPDVRVELLAGCKQDEEAKWHEACRQVEELDLDGLNLSAEGFTPERLAAVHNAGRTMAVWTVDEPAVMQELARAGVDGIITDRPDVCLEVLGKIGMR